MPTRGETVRCTGCDFEHVDLLGGIVLEYRAGSQTLHVGFRTEAWCDDCQTLRSIESLPSVEDLSDRVREAEEFVQGTPWQQRKDRAGMPMDRRRIRARDILAQRQEALAWGRARVSAPRCLTCGGTRWRLPDWQLAESRDRSVTTKFRHGCGGVLVRWPFDHWDALMQPVQRYVLNAEGQVLEVLDGADFDFHFDALEAPVLEERRVRG